MEGFKLKIADWRFVVGLFLGNGIGDFEVNNKMALIELKTLILAPPSRVFDLARSIDAHVVSASQTGERPVDGRKSGLMRKGETVTWEATHFRVRQRLTVKMFQLERPVMFEDEMLTGPFASMCHRHDFKELDIGTLMTDRFEFMAPMGILGRIAESLFLTNYVKAFLIKRNEELKKMAESDRWKEFLA